MGICVGKKGKIIFLNANKNEQFENEKESYVRIIKLYHKNSILQSLSINESKVSSLPSFNSTEFSEINNDAYDSDLNNNNTFKEILDIFNVQKN